MSDAPAGFEPLVRQAIAPPAGFQPIEIERTPLQPPAEPGPVIPQEEGGPMVLESQPDIPDRIKRAASAGVIFDRPAPAGNTLASFAFDQEQRVEAFRQAIKEQTGQDVKVRIGPETGAIEYFVPGQNRFALATPSLTFGDLAGAGVMMAPEILGASSAAIISKSPLLVEAGASGGAFIGELIRLQIGKELGINQDVSQKQMIVSALKEAGIAMAAGVGTNKLVKAGKFVLDLMNSKILPKEAAEALDISIDEAQRVVDDVNDKIGAEKFRLTLAQATGDDELLNLADFYKRSKEFGKEFGQFTDAQQVALKEYLAAINKPYRSRLGPAETGQAVQDTLRSGLENEKRRLDVMVASKEAELDNSLLSLAERPKEDLGPILREIGDSEQAAFRVWADDAALALNNLAGDKPFISNANTFEVVKDIDERVSRALFPSIQQPQRRLIGEPVADAVTELPEDAAAIASVRNKLFDPNAKFTFLEAWEAISALKRVTRTASKGLSTDDPDVGALKRLTIALEKDLRASSESSPLRENYEQFIRRYQAEKTRLDRGVVGKIMTRDGPKGRFVVADEAVFRQVFKPGGKREAQEIKALVGDDPEIMQGVRESIVDFYKGEVLRDGRVDLQAHKRFLERYALPLREYFTKNELRFIARPGQVEKALQAREQARKTALTEINKTFDSEIANLNNPGAIVSLIMDPKNPQKAAQLMKSLEKTPDVKRAVQTQVRKVMAERVAGEFQKGERVLSAARFKDFLSGKSGQAGFAPVLREVFGEQYVRDLEVLDQALTLTAREARFPNRSNTAFWIDTVKNLSRAYVGLFTRPGRFITALDRLRGRAANRVIMNAMLNPKDLRSLMELRGVDLRAQQAAATVGALGGSALLQDFE